MVIFKAFGSSCSLLLLVSSLLSLVVCSPLIQQDSHSAGLQLVQLTFELLVRVGQVFGHLSELGSLILSLFFSRVSFLAGVFLALFIPLPVVSPGISWFSTVA